MFFSSTDAMKTKDHRIESLVISHEIGSDHTRREMLFAVSPLNIFNTVRSLFECLVSGVSLNNLNPMRIQRFDSGLLHSLPSFLISSREIFVALENGCIICLPLLNHGSRLNGSKRRIGRRACSCREGK